MINKYIQKEPDKIKAVQWKGDNFEEVDKFCTIELDGKEIHYAEIWDEPHSRPDEVSEEIREKWSKPRISLIGDMWSGDVAYFGDYIVIGDEFYHIDAKDFEAEWELTDEPQTYKRKKLLELEAIQWTDETTEECLEFIRGDGSLDASGQQILLMNFSGGSIVNKEDYIIKDKNNVYGIYSINKNSFEKNYKKI